MREAEYGGAAFMVPSKSRPEYVAQIKEIEVGKTARGGPKHLTDQEVADTAGVSLRQVQDDIHENNETRSSAHFANAGPEECHLQCNEHAKCMRAESSFDDSPEVPPNTQEG